MSDARKAKRSRRERKADESSTDDGPVDVLPDAGRAEEPSSPDAPVHEPSVLDPTERSSSSDGRGNEPTIGGGGSRDSSWEDPRAKGAWDDQGAGQQSWAATQAVQPLVDDADPESDQPASEPLISKQTWWWVAFWSLLAIAVALLGINFYLRSQVDSADERIGAAEDAATALSGQLAEVTAQRDEYATQLSASGEKLASQIEESGLDPAELTASAAQARQAARKVEQAQKAVDDAPTPQELADATATLRAREAAASEVCARGTLAAITAAYSGSDVEEGYQEAEAMLRAVAPACRVAVG